MTSLYTLDRAPWSDICLVNIFCHLVARWLFIVSFEEQTFFILVSPINQFFFDGWYFCVFFKEILTNSKSWNYSSWNFIVLALTFRFIIHLNLTFVCGTRQGLRFFSSYGTVFLTPLIKDFLFPVESLCRFFCT